HVSCTYLRHVLLDVFRRDIASIISVLNTHGTCSRWYIVTTNENDNIFS
ncbi:unnamed protein product, partial [Brassica oleracea]